MKEINLPVSRLSIRHNRQEHINILQEINTLVLTQYALKIDDNFTVYPVEVEAYYYSHSFPDDTVHKSELQKNRFGKCYFHRKGQHRANKILFSRSGIDICLSESDDYFFGMLIRSAKINDEDHVETGPQRLAQRIYRHICDDETLTNLSEENRSVLTDFERNTTVLVRTTVRKVPLFIHSSRIGLNNESPYAHLPLRSLTDLNVSKQKEKDVLAYMRYNGVAPTPTNIRKILGSNSNRIIQQMTSD
ncbi:MAG: hypothetical protein LBH80_05800 [Prevotellaceae bacterium]|jgi:hypothetical protein|nr:hypothetical protein [Prevotellaceae bacterium]